MSLPSGSPPSTSLDRVALRLVGSLLVLGGVVMLAIAVAISQFPTVTRAGDRLYILPGSGGQHGLEPLGMWVLAGAGTMLAFVGSASLILSRLSPRRPPTSAAPISAKIRPGRATRPIWILALGVAALAAALVFRQVVSHP